MRYRLKDYQTGKLQGLVNSYCYCCGLRNDAQVQYVYLEDEHGEMHCVSTFFDDGIVTVHSCIEDMDRFASWLEQQHIKEPETYDYQWFDDIEFSYDMYIATQDHLLPWLQHHAHIQDHRIDIPLDALFDNANVHITFDIAGILSYLYPHLVMDDYEIRTYPNQESILRTRKETVCVDIRYFVTDDEVVKLHCLQRDKHNGIIAYHNVELGAYPGVLSFHLDEKKNISDVSYQEKLL